MLVLSRTLYTTISSRCIVAPVLCYWMRTRNMHRPLAGSNANDRSYQYYSAFRATRHAQRNMSSQDTADIVPWDIMGMLNVESTVINNVASYRSLCMLT